MSTTNSNIPDRTPSKQRSYYVPGGKLYFVSKGYDEATNTYEPSDSWCIADGGGWLPGIYTTREAAEAALKLNYQILLQLQEQICEKLKRDIALTDIQNLST